MTLEALAVRLESIAAASEARAERHEERASRVQESLARIEATQQAQAREIGLIQAHQVEVARTVVDLRVGQSEMRAELASVASSAKRPGFLEGLTQPDGFLRTPAGIALLSGCFGLAILLGIGLGWWSREDATHAIKPPAILSPAPQPAAAPQP